MKRILIYIFMVVMMIGCRQTRVDKIPDRQLIFWHSFVASTVPILDVMISEFEKQYPDIHIRAQYVPTGDALIQKLVTAIQSHTNPDISWIHADYLDRLVNANAVLPLNGFFSEDSLFSEVILPDIYQQLLKPVTFRDTIFALPMEATTLALLYNRDLFRKAGLDPDHPPSNWAELDSFALRLCNDVNGDGGYDRFGFYVPVFPASGSLNLWMVIQWTPFLWQAGGHLFQGNQPLFNSEAGIAALNFWKNLYNQQQFDRFSMGHDVGFVSQTVAMILDGPWNLPRYRKNIDFDWSVASLPSGLSGCVTYLSGEHLVIFRQCQQPKAAWRFIRWFLEPEVQKKFAQQSGYLPVLRSVQRESDYTDYLKTYPQQRIFNEQVQWARGWELPERYRVEVNQKLAEALENTIRGGQDARKALTAAEQQIVQLLKPE